MVSIEANFQILNNVCEVKESTFACLPPIKIVVDCD
jgi:hypothetical protein